MNEHPAHKVSKVFVFKLLVTLAVAYLSIPSCQRRCAEHKSVLGYQNKKYSPLGLIQMLLLLLELLLLLLLLLLYVINHVLIRGREAPPYNP